MVERSIVSRQEALICDLESKMEFQSVQIKRFEVGCWPYGAGGAFLDRGCSAPLRLLHPAGAGAPPPGQRDQGGRGAGEGKGERGTREGECPLLPAAAGGGEGRDERAGPEGAGGQSQAGGSGKSKGGGIYA